VNSSNSLAFFEQLFGRPPCAEVQILLYVVDEVKGNRREIDSFGVAVDTPGAERRSSPPETAP